MTPTPKLPPWPCPICGRMIRPSEAADRLPSDMTIYLDHRDAEDPMLVMLPSRSHATCRIKVA